jgi:hypothetical protein
MIVTPAVFAAGSDGWAAHGAALLDRHELLYPERRRKTAVIGLIAIRQAGGERLESG